MTKGYQHGANNDAQMESEIIFVSICLRPVVSLTEVRRGILKIESTKINGKPENEATRTRAQKWDRKNIGVHPQLMASFIPKIVRKS